MVKSPMLSYLLSTVDIHQCSWFIDHVLGYEVRKVSISDETDPGALLLAHQEVQSKFGGHLFNITFEQVCQWEHRFVQGFS